MTQIPMGGSGEFDRIRAISRALGDAVGALGDDTATVPAGLGDMVVSTDVSVENVHFRLAWLSFEEIGWRAAASALSDLAAAGATPAGVTAAVTVPTELEEEDLVALMRGVGAAAQSVGCRVLGGDLSSGNTLALAITVFGHREIALSRRGAQPGDGLWVTGSLGGARAALSAWLLGNPPVESSRVAFARPTPRIVTGRWLAAHGATAMMDTSDGLGGDAVHLAAASAVGLRIELERLPLHPDVVVAASIIGEDPAYFAAVGGEDYELLVTLPREFDHAAKCLAETGVLLTRIGSVRRDLGVMATLMGNAVVVPGFEHSL